jgi:hypothetical protein
MEVMTVLLTCILIINIILGSPALFTVFMFQLKFVHTFCSETECESRHTLTYDVILECIKIVTNFLHPTCRLQKHSYKREFSISLHIKKPFLCRQQVCFCYLGMLRTMLDG